MKIHIRDIVVLIALVAVAIFTYNHFVSGDCYGYDEADYMYAASKGLWVNYVDAGTIPITTFIEMGRRYGMEKQKRTTLAEFIRSSDDVSFYRHYHGPLYHYGLILTRALFGARERTVRWYSLAILVVSVAVMFLLLRFLLVRNDFLAALLPAVLLLFSRNNIIASAHVTPHGL